MCGVIGVYLKNITLEQIQIVSAIIQESSIRGIHATGITCLQDGHLNTVKTHLSATKFLEHSKLSGYLDSDGGLYLIAHTRYSTSDLQYNQPLGDTELAISHNGVISQSAMDAWENIFGLKTTTANDSELILQAFNGGLHPLTKFKGSMAVCVVSKNKKLTAFRNHARPLWYQQFGNGIIFASTEDILKRAGCSTCLKCEMFTEYVYSKGQLTTQSFPIPDGVTDLQ